MDRVDPDTLARASPPPATSAADEPRRREPRARTLLSGKIVFGVHDLTGDCTIRNLSNGGAKIQTSLAASLPREFWLIVVKRGVAYRASIAWRREEELGLRLDIEHDLADSRDPQLKIAQHVWKQVSDR